VRRRQPSRRGAVAVAVSLALAAFLAAEAQAPTRRRGFSVEVTEPADGNFVVGKTRIAATVKAEGADSIDRVEFLIGDQVIFVDREPPYECVHDFGETSRSWVIQAVAYHSEGVSVRDVVITRRIPFMVVERVNRVVLWLSASDKQGGFATDLKREDLRLLEDGRPQEILEFQREDRPITLAILLDSSASMKEKLEEVHDAAAAFVDTLRPEDRALVIDFNDRVFLLEDLTADRERLKRAIVSTEALGGTALYDVLHAAYRKIGTIEGRKAIVLLSDGEDTASQFGFERVIEEAKSNPAIIYAIGLGGEGGGPRRSVLKELSSTTGGRAYFVKTAAQLADVYRQIAEELRAQYSVAYSTANEVWDGRWIKLEIESARQGLEFRARRGFFAVHAGSP